MYKMYSYDLTYMQYVFQAGNLLTSEAFVCDSLSPRNLDELAMRLTMETDTESKYSLIIREIALSGYNYL